MSQQPANPMKQLRATFEGPMRAEIAKALPKGIDPDRFIRTAVTSVQMNPDLLYADRRSLFGACMDAARDGLMPDGREAVLNIYNTKKKVDGRDEWVPTVQYLPMVRGILRIMRNTGLIAHIDAAAVYEKDKFAFQRGDDPKIIHDPYLGDDEPGKVIASYIIVKLTNGEVHREVMPRRDIEKTRGASKSGDGANSPWTKWYDQMAIKAVIKRAAKILPTSSEALDRVLQNDNDAMGFDFNQRGADVSAAIEAPAKPAVTTGRPSRLAAIVQQHGTTLAQPLPADAEPVENYAEALREQAQQSRDAAE